MTTTERRKRAEYAKAYHDALLRKVVAVERAADRVDEQALLATLHGPDWPYLDIKYRKLCWNVKQLGWLIDSLADRVIPLNDVRAYPYPLRSLRTGE